MFKDDEINYIILNDAKVWLDRGVMFGALGSGYMRMNIALPKDKLDFALKNIERAFKDF